MSLCRLELLKMISLNGTWISPECGKGTSRKFRLLAGLIWAVLQKNLAGRCGPRGWPGQTSLLQNTMEHCAGEAGSSLGMFWRVWPCLPAAWYVLMPCCERNVELCWENLTILSPAKKLSKCRFKLPQQNMHGKSVRYFKFFTSCAFQVLQLEILDEAQPWSTLSAESRLGDPRSGTKCTKDRRFRIHWISINIMCICLNI